MDPSEVEFLAEKEKISIQTNFSEDKIYLIGGDIGPFNASLPTEVPLWIAIFLKQRRKCRILPPDWMDVGNMLFSTQITISSWLGQDSEEKKCSLNGLNEVYVTDMAKQLNALTLSWRTPISKYLSATKELEDKQDNISLYSPLTSAAKSRRCHSLSPPPPLSTLGKFP
ncbi:hypothetical protein pdam_00002393 [Pocillopora damicornis]|uniref:DNA replication complex GINS protein PSF2 N-terminal domain-containing protein n=1 Tax=Pocillopora damicornis TaxID=46731 RepID=A0A3M6UTC7_POCDA|nr:hypothetical protein pdam_00002393 [Pocillopora damicornis]